MFFIRFAQPSQVNAPKNQVGRPTYPGKSVSLAQSDRETPRLVRRAVRGDQGATTGATRQSGLGCGGDQRAIRGRSDSLVSGSRMFSDVGRLPREAHFRATPLLANTVFTP